MTGTTVRVARLDDRDQVWPLARDLATSYDLQADAFADSFAALVDAPDVLLLVAEQGDRLVGYLLAQQQHTFHANGPAVWVQEIVVSDDQRGAGIGRELMAAAETWATAKGAAYVALATRRAADFYTAVGYEPSATYFKRRL